MLSTWEGVPSREVSRQRCGLSSVAVQTGASLLLGTSRRDAEHTCAELGYSGSTWWI